MEAFVAAEAKTMSRCIEAVTDVRKQIDERTAKFKADWAQLHLRWARLEKVKAEASATALGANTGSARPPIRPIVKLNVGGTHMAVSRAVLTHATGSMLEAMFSKRWEDRLPRDSNGRIFLDVSPVCFRKLVEFLSNMVIAPPGKGPPLPPLTEDEKPCFEHLVHALHLWHHVYGSHSQSSPPDSTSLSATATTTAVAATTTDSKAYRDDVERFGDAVAASFRAGEYALRQAQTDFDLAAGASFGGEQATVTALAGSSTTTTINFDERDEEDEEAKKEAADGIVTFNLGGMQVATRQSTLRLCGKSSLTAMFNSENEGGGRMLCPFTIDSNGHYFVEHGRYNFSKIIEVLRLRKATLLLPITGRRAPWRVFVQENEMVNFERLVKYLLPGREEFILSNVVSAYHQDFLSPRTMCMVEFL